MSRCKLWSRYVKDDDGLPKALPEPAPDYIGVMVDGKTVKPDREDGGGPDGRSLRADEGLRELRSMYIPRDGQPHTVVLTFRVTGEPHYRARVTLPPIAVEPPTPPAAAPTYTEAQAATDMQADALAHARFMGVQLVDMGRSSSQQIATLFASQADAQRQMTAALLKAQADAAAQTAAIQAQAVQAATAAAQAAAGGVEAAVSAAVAAQQQPGIVAQVSAFADSPMGGMILGGVLEGIKRGWEGLGGWEGLKAKIGGAVGGEARAAAASDLAGTLYACVDRVSTAIETHAVAGVDLGGVELGADEALDAPVE